MDDFFKNDTDGLKRVKAIVKKAISNKKPEFKLNTIRLMTLDGKGRWAKECFTRSKVISDIAVVVFTKCGTGLGVKLYGPLLYVDGLGSISVRQPPTNCGSSHTAWLEVYNTVFKDYQLHLVKSI